MQPIDLSHVNQTLLQCQQDLKDKREAVRLNAMKTLHELLIQLLLTNPDMETHSSVIAIIQLAIDKSKDVYCA